MSMTARAQSLDWLTAWTIWPFGMVNTSPFGERSLVTRNVTFSTVPLASVVGHDGQRDQVTEAILLLDDDEEPRQDDP